MEAMTDDTLHPKLTFHAYSARVRVRIEMRDLTQTCHLSSRQLARSTPTLEEMTRNETTEPIRNAPKPVVGLCLVCGTKTPPPPDNPYRVDDGGGGRRRRYCSDRCKQRGYRLRRANGEDWWLKQPWRIEFDRLRADREAAAASAAKAKELAMSLMPPEERRRVEKAEFDQQLHAMKVVADQLGRAERRWKLTGKLSDEMFLAAMEGRKLRFGDPCDDEQIAKLLNHAVACDSNTEAQAFFDKARALWTEGAA
jgi:hypothetical protein